MTLEEIHTPIWQAPTGSIAGPELAAAVCAGGGVGAMALSWANEEEAAAQVSQVVAQTDRPFLVNYALMKPPISLEAALQAGAPIVSFSWGDAEPWIEQVHEHGALCGQQVTNLAGARRALEIGCDFLVCQGIEAGGHVQSTTPLLALVRAVRREVGADVYIVAAGGIISGRELAWTLSAGATACMVGTRYVATQESRAHPDYKRLLVESQGQTALTVCFDGSWPYASHRVLRNSTLETWEAQGSPPVGKRPGENDVLGKDASGSPLKRYDDTTPRAGFSGQIEAMCLYAGSGVEQIHDLPSATDLTRRMLAELKQSCYSNSEVADLADGPIA